MTSLEKLQFDTLKNHPNGKLLINQLDLIVSNSALKHSQLVSNRVDELLASFKSKPVAQRTALREGTDSIFDQNRIETHLIQFYGPRPWKFPLTKTPF